MTQKTDLELPGWQREEDLNCQAGCGCLNNATVETRPEDVEWAPLVWQDTWTVGQWYPVIGLLWTGRKGGDPQTDYVIKGADSELLGWQPEEKVT